MKSGEQQNLIVEMQHGMFDLFLQKKKAVRKSIYRMIISLFEKSS